jgi:RNA polymerase sigma factor (sigma-70 family)
MAEQAGGNDFLGELRDSVRDWARQLIGPRLGRREDASDLAQETVLDLFASDLLAGLTPEAREKQARQVLRRRLADLIRRHYRRVRDVRREAPLQDLASTPSGIEQLLGEHGVSPLDEASQHEHQARLVVALASLPRKEQEVLRRRYFQHQEWHAIARDLGVAPSSIMRWADRGIAAMRAFFREDLES